MGPTPPQSHLEPGIRVPYRRHRKQSSIPNTAPGPQQEALPPLPRRRNLRGVGVDREHTHLSWIRKKDPSSPRLSGTQRYRPQALSLIARAVSSSPFLSPQKAVVARRLRSKGGAHLLQIPWHAGYVTPWRRENPGQGEETRSGGWPGCKRLGFTSTNPCRILTKMTQP